MNSLVVANGLQYELTTLLFLFLANVRLRQDSLAIANATAWCTQRESTKGINNFTMLSHAANQCALHSKRSVLIRGTLCSVSGLQREGLTSGGVWLLLGSSRELSGKSGCWTSAESLDCSLNPEWDAINTEIEAKQYNTMSELITFRITKAKAVENSGQIQFTSVWLWCELQFIEFVFQKKKRKRNKTLFWGIGFTSITVSKARFGGVTRELLEKLGEIRPGSPGRFQKLWGSLTPPQRHQNCRQA